MRRLWPIMVALVVGAFVLTACGTQKNEKVAPFNVASQAAAMKVGCDKAAAVSKEITHLAAFTPDREKSDGLKAWGFNDPQNQIKLIGQVQKALVVRTQDCAKNAASASPSASPSKVTCASSWPMAIQTPGNGNWVAPGIPSIAQAKTKAEAQAAATDWVNKIKGNPGTLGGASAYLLHKQVNAATLVDPKGCASTAAKVLVSELSVALALADISPDQAPAGATNTGTSNGTVVANAVAGISGNRKAIKIVLKDGTTVWVMARCGNAVTVGQPPVPSVPPVTPPGTTVHVCPPSMPHGVFPVCKDDPSRDPAAQGNVPPQVRGTAPPVTGPATRPSATPSKTYVAPTPPPAPTTPRSTAPSSPQASAPPTASPAPSGNPCNGPNPDPNFC